MSTRTKAAPQPSSKTNPRKVAAAAKARAALALKRAREKSGDLVKGGAAPQIGAGGGPFPPSHTAVQNFPPGQGASARGRVAGRAEILTEGSQRPQVDLPPGAMSEHDAPNAPFVPPPQPVVEVLPDGRKLVR